MSDAESEPNEGKELERDIIKQHHARMRQMLREGKGVDEVWGENLKDGAGLVKYAGAMKALGEAWKGERDVPERVEWAFNVAMKYYRGTESSLVNDDPPAKKRKIDAERVTGLVRTLLKPEKRKYFEEHKTPMPEDLEKTHIASLSASVDLPPTTRIATLDVGSCYDPFTLYDKNSELAVTAVDLCPAEGSPVLQCDFTTVRFSDELAVESGKVSTLPAGGYHVVVFSLLLSYMPCPKMRFKCFQNAFRALKPNGLLLVITTRTVGKKNLKWLEQWNAAAASINFVRMTQDVRKKIICVGYRKASEEADPGEGDGSIPIGADEL